jgi:hypothetical protein
MAISDLHSQVSTTNRVWPFSSRLKSGETDSENGD